MSKKCPKCGKEYPEGVMYCFDCKVKLNDTLSDTGDGRIEHIGDNGRNKKRRIRMKYLTLIISFLCVAVIGTIVLFALGNGKKGGGSNEVEAKSEIPESSQPAAVSKTESTEVSMDEASCVSQASGTSQTSDVSQPDDISKPDSESTTSDGNQNASITVQYYDFDTLVSKMKAADEKYNLTTFDYSTFSIKEQYDFAGFTYGASLNEPGSSYTMVSDQFETELSISRKVAGTQLLLSKNTQSGEISAQCDLQHKPGYDKMYDSEKNFFKVVLHAVLQSDYDKISDEIDGFLNTDGLTLTNSSFYEIYNKETDLGDAALGMSVFKREGEIVEIYVWVESK
jgi:cytoskeletal protein RodZ